MSFKSSLEALFKLSGSQAMPSNATIEQTLELNEWTSITAPFDGYFTVLSTGDSGELSLIEIQCTSSKIYNKVTADTKYKRYGACFIPCKKGNYIQYCISTGATATTVQAYFTKTVGSS